ncbi:uncharacterized protein OCT59_010301 [Rhizophagus irregularis]|uniref:Uncharacterized protein n=1 Tax=Rhizophagus irregularis (strain DAOM 181602 / DAOM 197198 / MUCL 43194) TaxID=747089 RepID=U9TYU8_RHIID|nr:hypothetical protein OCT59_010301 [Rhizophagus irregularis]GBC30206.1 hypothetical protein GLOIN_2v1474383 [Rhizophagus irregularis DAOM 181602=DAOM 197198]CAG8459039.1 23122_t:CDS:2 [Rhizophagus irregularis]
MAELRWYQKLSSNDRYQQVIDIHEQFQDITVNSQAGYYYIKVDNERIWVPLLPGYTIYTAFGDNIFKLFIEHSNQLLFSWVNFGTDVNCTTPIASNSQPDHF